MYACLRILRNLHATDKGLRTSLLKNRIREEETLIMSLKSLRNYEFIKSVEYLQERGLIEAIYPGDATEWLKITDKGRHLLVSTSEELMNALKEAQAEIEESHRKQ